MLDRLHLRRHSAEREVKVEDPDGKVTIKERVDPATARDTAPERDVHPNTPPATDPASPKVFQYYTSTALSPQDSSMRFDLPNKECVLTKAHQASSLQSRQAAALTSTTDGPLYNVFWKPILPLIMHRAC